MVSRLNETQLSAFVCFYGSKMITEIAEKLNHTWAGPNVWGNQTAKKALGRSKSKNRSPFLGPRQLSG